jgi:hypothetical protein
MKTKKKTALTATERKQAQKMGEAMMRIHKKAIARENAKLKKLEAARKKGLIPEFKWHRGPNVFQFKISTGHWFWVWDGDYDIHVQLQDKPFKVNYKGFIGCSESIKYENAGEVEADISCLENGESCEMGDEGIEVSKKKGSYFVEGVKVSDNDIRVLCLVLKHLSCYECSPSKGDETWLVEG